MGPDRADGFGGVAVGGSDAVFSLTAASNVSPEPSCFHCGLPVPAPSRWLSDMLGRRRDFCCAGCQAIAGAIVGNGLEDYYRLRTATAPTASPDESCRDGLFDREDLQRSFVRNVGVHREASLLLERVRCPACLWLNERRLQSLPGVIEATVAYASQSARVRWDPSRIALSQILAAVREIGHEARPLDPSHRAGLESEAARRNAPRLLFAGVLGMMVMNLSLAAYFAGGPDPAGSLPLWESFARWGSLAATAVLLAYCGQDFFLGAWQDLKRRRAGMDVPIVLGLLAAWAGSLWATVGGSGPVYYDAIAMLVFFVLLARAFETRARRTACAVAGIDLSKQNQAELVIAHAYQPPSFLPTDVYIAPAVYDELDSKLRENAEKKLNGLLEEARREGVQARWLLLSGAPYEAIAKAAGESQVDLVILGTHGRTGVSRFFLGSVAARVISTAPCPVMTVRAA